MAEIAGAEHYYRDGGWLKVYRTEAAFAAARQQLAIAEEHDVGVVALSAEETVAAEPHLKPVFTGSVLWTDLRSVSEPGRRGEGIRQRPAPPGRGLRHRRRADASHRGEQRVVGRGPRWHDQRARSRRCARPLGGGCPPPARLPPADCRQARLSHALLGRGECHPHAARARRRARLRDHADGARHPPHHRLGIRAAATRRRRRCSSISPNGTHANSSRSTGGSRQSHGWARGRACPTCCR